MMMCEVRGINSVGANTKPLSSKGTGYSNLAIYYFFFLFRFYSTQQEPKSCIDAMG